MPCEGYEREEPSSRPRCVRWTCGACQTRGNGGRHGAALRSASPAARRAAGQGLAWNLRLRGASRPPGPLRGASSGVLGFAFLPVFLRGPWGLPVQFWGEGWGTVGISVRVQLHL